MAAQQELKQQVMDGLDRSCGGIEEVISSIDLGNVNFSQLRSELVRRIATLDRRLEQHSEELDDYFVQLIVLRMENYAQFVAKLDDLSEAIGRYGGQDATAESFEESFEPPADVQPSADEQAPATGFESQPAAQPHMPPPGVPAFAEQSGSPGESPSLQHEQADEAVFDAGAVAFDVPPSESEKPMMQEEVDAPTMQFSSSPVPEQFGWGQQTPLHEAPPTPPPQQEPAEPEAPPEPVFELPQTNDNGGAQGNQCAPAQPEESSEDQDDDLIYAQTMQFSMQDIEAARRGEAISMPRPGEQQQEQQSSQWDPGAGSNQDSAADQSSSAMSPGDGGETVMFDPTETSRQYNDSSYQQPQQASPQQQPQPPQQPQQKKKQKSKDGSMITGSDLMDQMDSFFDFGQR